MPHERTMNLCRICKNERVANGGNVQLRGGASICMNCLHEKVDPKRAERLKVSIGQREDYLLIRNREILAIRATTKEANGELEKVREQVEAELEVLRRLKKVNAATRKRKFLSFLFGA